MPVAGVRGVLHCSQCVLAGASLQHVQGHNPLVRLCTVDLLEHGACSLLHASEAVIVDMLAIQAAGFAVVSQMYVLCS